jgi:hypothetical protein
MTCEKAKGLRLSSGVNNAESFAFNRCSCNIPQLNDDERQL